MRTDRWPGSLMALLLVAALCPTLALVRLWAETTDDLLVNQHHPSWALECVRTGDADAGFYSTQLWYERTPGGWYSHALSIPRNPWQSYPGHYLSGPVSGKPEPW